MLLIAAVLWIGVGIMLLSFARSWLRGYDGDYHWVFISSGLGLALLKYFLVFKKMADHNLRRISAMDEKIALYKIYTPGTYILIFVMMALGILARKTGFPRACLASIDIAIGLGLIMGALRFFMKMKKRDD